MSHNAPFLHRNMLAYGREATFELVIKSKSTSGVSLRVAGGTRSSLISVRHKTATDGALKTTTHRIDDFPIFLSVDDPSLADPQGKTFVSVSLRISEGISMPLMSGSVYELKPLTYPTNTMRDPMPNRGEIGAVLSAVPSAGAEVSITLDDDETWLVMWMEFAMTGDGTGGTRNVRVTFADPLGRSLLLFGPNAHSIAATRKYILSQLGDPRSNSQDVNFPINLPRGLWLSPSSVIATDTSGIESGDQFTAMIVMREKFYSGT